LIAGAVLTSLAYPPFHFFVPSFVCLIPAIVLIERGNADSLPFRRSFQYGFFFGLLSNGVLLYWMVFALWRYTPLALLGYASTVLLLSAYCAGMFALCGWIVRTTGVSMVLVFPVLWTALERVLGHQSDLSFPWLGLGTSLTGFPTVVQLADLVGARGVTLLLALANAALALAWAKRDTKTQAIRLVGAVAVGVVAATAYGFIREKTLTTRSLGEVVLLQPNVGYNEKWNLDLREEIIGSLFSGSTTASREVDPDLIVWPEVAVPGDLGGRRDWKFRISTFAGRSGTPMVVGALHRVTFPDSTSVSYNAAFVFDSAGRTDHFPVYHKNYLVPITERVPFLPRGMLDLRWFGSFGAGSTAPTYEVGLGSFGVLICYESTFENLARRYRVGGAEFLVNITNDVWFGKTTAPGQHASHLVMRAIENRVGVARAANTGVSELVDPLGRASKRTDMDVETYTSGIVQTSDVLTVYSRFGDWVGRAVLSMSLILAVYAWWRNRQPI